MLGRQERIVLIILCAVTAVVLTSYLALEIAGKESFSGPYRDDSPVGSLVRLTGKVEQVTRIENGGHLILLVNRTRVFVPAGSVPDAGIAKGDSLVVLGVVQNYRGDREITVSQPEDIRIQPGFPPA
jgi:uncharacterized ubiquitin-like protein YukD